MPSGAGETSLLKGVGSTRQDLSRRDGGEPMQSTTSAPGFSKAPHVSRKACSAAEVGLLQLESARKPPPMTKTARAPAAKANAKPRLVFGCGVTATSTGGGSGSLISSGRRMKQGT